MEVENTFMEHFNPRSHERSDLRDKDTLNVMWNFNPRSHERSDDFEVLKWKKLKISIHAPTRGATL